MSNFKKYSFLVLSIFSFYSSGQAIDESILSQLSPQQIEMAKDAYASSNSTDITIEELPPIDESLVDKESRVDANRFLAKNMAMISFYQCLHLSQRLETYLYLMTIKYLYEINFQ